MPAPLAVIGEWSETRLTRFVEDWFRNHDLPATKALQADALRLGTRTITDLVSSFNGRVGDVLPQAGDYAAALIANALDLSNAGTQTLAGTLTAAALQVGGKALPGTEIGYDPITATVNVTGTTSAAPTTVIAAAAHTFDGSPVLMEFFAERFSTPSLAAGNTTTIGLYEAGSLVAIVAQIITPTAGQVGSPALGSLRFTPTAGNHTYTIAAFSTNTTGTPAVSAGSGVAGNAAPAYLRFTKV